MFGILARRLVLSRCASLLKPLFPFTYTKLLYSDADADVFSLLFVTVQDVDAAKNLARTLLDKKLAACTNVIPTMSVHYWKGEIVEDIQVLLMIKTRTSAVCKLTAYVSTNLPYEIVEVVSLHIKSGNPPYLKWLGDIVPA